MQRIVRYSYGLPSLTLALRALGMFVAVVLILNLAVYVVNQHTNTSVSAAEAVR